MGERQEQATEWIVDATPAADDSGIPQAIKQSASAKKEQDAQRAANRLRAAGYSYRRIAETLRVPYITVSRWLSGVDDYPPPRHPVSETSSDSAHGEPHTSQDGQAQADGSTSTAEQAASSANAQARTTNSEDDSDLAHRVEVLALQFQAFESYARDMAEDFNKHRDELLEKQYRAVEEMETEREKISLSRKSFEGAVSRFDNRFNEVTEELRAEMAKLKATVADEIKSLRSEIEALKGGAGAGAVGSAASFGDSFADDNHADPFATEDEPDPLAMAEEEDPFASDDDDDPFAANDEEDPFAVDDDDDPFSGGTDDDSDDPFGDDEEDPFADDEEDPFADDDDDPFADDEEDPFA